jgi:hypothetical protein
VRNKPHINKREFDDNSGRSERREKVMDAKLVLLMLLLLLRLLDAVDLIQPAELDDRDETTVDVSS